LRVPLRRFGLLQPASEGKHANLATRLGTAMNAETLSTPVPLGVERRHDALNGCDPPRLNHPDGSFCSSAAA
jgi:hypothetical protein